MVDSKPLLPQFLNQRSAITKSTIPLVLAQGLVESLFGLLGGAPGFRNLPLHFAGADFILRDAAGLAGIGVDHRRRTGLKLARAPRCHQNVSVVAVKAFDQLHWDSPSKNRFEVYQCRTSSNAFNRTGPTLRLVPRDSTRSFRRPFRRP